MIKIFDLVTEKYWRNEEGDLFVYSDEEQAKEAMRKEGYKEEYIETGVEYHPHTPIDKTGYDLQ